MSGQVSRRDVLKSAAAAGVGMSVPGLSNFVLMEQDIPKASRRVRNFERMAFGMFVHWGLYSQMQAGEWVETMHGIPRDRYLKLMDTFTAEDFDARDLARTAKSAGMKYITLTSRHHEGFSLYDTRGLSDLDITHTPAKGRDLIEEFLTACRAEGIVPMLYHTTLDWNDKRFNEDFDGYLDYLHDSVELLCTEYGEIGGFWFDGNWAKKDADWKEDRLYTMIRKLQPEAMIINNTGIDAGGKLGHPEIDSTTFERGRPKPIDRTGHEKYVSGEMCHTVNFHWGTAAKDFNFLSPAHVIEELLHSRKAGANLLMNIGPEKHGKVPDYEKALLAKVGEWVELHDNIIYEGVPNGIAGDGDDFGLVRDGETYLFVTNITPTASTYAHGGPKARGGGQRPFDGVAGSWSKAQWLDNGEELKVEHVDGRLVLHATNYPYGTNTVIRVAKLIS